MKRRFPVLIMGGALVLMAIMAAVLTQQPSTATASIGEELIEGVPPWWPPALKTIAAKQTRQACQANGNTHPDCLTPTETPAPTATATATPTLPEPQMSLQQWSKLRKSKITFNRLRHPAAQRYRFQYSYLGCNGVSGWTHTQPRLGNSFSEELPLASNCPGGRRKITILLKIDNPGEPQITVYNQSYWYTFAGPDDE